MHMCTVSKNETWLTALEKLEILTLVFGAGYDDT